MKEKITQKDTNPFKYSDSNVRYHTMDYHMRSVFGKKACKVPVDAGFTCPNRDGTKGFGGCTFCSGKGSGEFAAGREKSITEQIDEGAAMMRKKWKDASLIPYFQAFTNTYADIPTLRRRYSEALSHKESAGLCIATRPDCVDDDVSALLHEIAKERFLMVELGLQTVSDETGRLINRRYDFSDFLSAYEKLSDLFVCVHLINGLPGEDRAGMVKSAEVIGKLRPSAVKIHSLYIVSGTKMAEDYLAGKFSLQTREEYVQTVCDQLEVLPPETVIERVTGDGAPDGLIAPEWSKKKLVVRNEIDKELFRRGSYQGKFFKGN